MTISSGARVGPYEIVSRIGAGGMGEVWKARDTRLERNVAIKVLPAEFAHDAQMTSRFEREAKTISQLEHPNICRLYDVGNGYLVMELLDGESLADRLVRGPLPLSDVLKVGAQIAGALGQAHRAGVVHRDVKPANVMLTRTGAKLLDFGLAKSRVIDIDAEGETLQKPLTREGTILGTVQYMSPEQLDGIEADARSDIFSLGALLYEMCTGRRAFEGKTKSSLIAAIVKDQPRPVSELQPLTPPALEHVIAKCLRKDPDERWQSAHDVAEELRWAAETESQESPRALTSAQRRWRWFYPVLAAVAIGVAAFLALMLSRERQVARREVVIPIASPAGTYFNSVGNESGAAVLSPDGQRLVFSAATAGGIATIWVQSIRTGEAKELPGTAGGKFPFWSPDSKNIAFFVNTKLKRVDLNGGDPIPIADAPNGRGGAWSSNGTIIFTPSTVAPLYGVSANGGAVTAVTKLTGIFTTHRWPQFLSDGEHFIYLSATHQNSASALNEIVLGSLDGKENRVLIKNVASGIVSANHLLFVREGTIYALKLGARFEPEGEPRAIWRGAMVDDAVWRSPISADDEGTLIYHTGSSNPRSELTWVDRSGKILGTVGPPDVYLDARLSPDGEKVLIGIGDPVRQIWMHDLRRDVRTRFTVTADWSGSPTWSPDGSTIYYVALQGAEWRLLTAPATGGRSPRVLASFGVQNVRTTGVSPDGRQILVDVDNNVMTIPAAGGEPQRIFRAGLTNSGVYSPDGKWIAYVSNENGSRDEVFIASSADPATHWQVSSEGGDSPQWRRDGKEIFYLNASGRTVAAVSIDGSGAEPQIDTPHDLFTAPVKQGYTDIPYSAAADGQRFLLNLEKAPESAGLYFVRDWRHLRQAP